MESEVLRVKHDISSVAVYFDWYLILTVLVHGVLGLHFGVFVVEIPMHACNATRLEGDR